MRAHRGAMSDDDEEAKMTLLSPSSSSSSVDTLGRGHNTRRHRQQELIGLLLKWELLIILTLVLANAILVLRRQTESLAEGATTHTETCSVTAFDSGQWTRKANPVTVTNYEQYLEAAGLPGCPTDRYYFGVGERKGEESGEGKDWSFYTEHLSYQWTPSAACDLKSLSIEQKVQLLVSRGGLLMVGDSLSFQHFFSLNCDLFSHIRWQGIPRDGDSASGHGRELLQHVFLDRNSSLLETLVLPDDFDIDRHPLITFSSAAIPLSNVELRALPGVDLDLVPLDYWGEMGRHYVQPSNLSLDLFADPTMRYSTMLVSFGAHISPGAAYPKANSIELQSLFRIALKEYFSTLQNRLSGNQRVLIRAAPPGHSVRSDLPLAEVPPAGDEYNWRAMPELNNVLQQEVELLQNDRMTWIGGERSVRMRPDAHLPGDGMHYMIGAGVFETWSRYLWHRLSS